MKQTCSNSYCSLNSALFLVVTVYAEQVTLVVVAVFDINTIAYQFVRFPVISQGSMTTYDKNQWLEQLERFPISLRTSVEKLLIPQVGYLAEAFYAKMLSDEDTRFFLTHEEVRNRLVFSMQDWLRQLFNTRSEEHT